MRVATAMEMGERRENKVGVGVERGVVGRVEVNRDRVGWGGKGTVEVSERWGEEILTNDRREEEAKNDSCGCGGRVRM